MNLFPYLRQRTGKVRRRKVRSIPAPNQSRNRRSIEHRIIEVGRHRGLCPNCRAVDRNGLNPKLLPVIYRRARV